MLNYSSHKIYLNLISLFSIIVFAFFCYASIGAEELDEEPISLLAGQIRIMPVDSPTRVSIANPEVADISSITEKEIVLAAKDQGNTTLTIWDKSGERSFVVKVFSEDLSQLKQEIDQLLSKLEITGLSSQVNEAQAKIVFMGNIQEEKKKIFDKAIKPYENKIINLVGVDEKNPLVLIDVEILEIGKNDLDDLGINWSTAMQFREEPYTASASDTGVQTSLDKIGGLSEIMRISSWSRDALAFRLNFLKTEGKARTLSRPKLVCLSGKNAEFLVGGEVPIVTVQTTSTGTTTNAEYKKYGISLTIKPTVKENNEIQTTIQTEVSDIDWANAVIASGVRIPAFSSRKASTELYIKEGQTIFIAGLLKNKDSDNVNKVPGLAEIPILGTLFRSKRFQLDQTELVISLTPTIMREGIPEKTQESIVSLPQIPEEPKEPVVKKEVPQDPLTQYTNAIGRKISEVATYPAIAEESRWEGEVRLSLHMLSDGNLDEVLLIKPSGINLLDETALNLVKSQASFPAFPAEIKEKDLWIDVTLVYQPE